MPNLVVSTLVLGVVGLLLALFVAVGIKRLPPGTVAMQEHLSHIKNITEAFTNKHYIIAAGLALVAFFVIICIFDLPAAISFICGVLVSILLLNRVMDIITEAGIRAAAAGNSTNPALAAMLCGSFVSAILVMALALLGCGLLFLITGHVGTINFFLLGISMVALLYSTGSNIFRSTSTGTENSYLLSSGSIAMDLFESCTVALAGVMTIGILVMTRFGWAGVLLPLVIFSAGLIACILVLILIIVYRQQDLGKIMGKAISFYTLFLIVFSLIAVMYLLPGEQFKVILALGAGLALALLLFLPLSWDIPSIFKQNGNLHRNRDFVAIYIPVLFLALLLSYYGVGFYGVSIIGLAVLLFTGMAVFIQSFAQIKLLAAGLAVGNDSSGGGDECYEEIINYFSITALVFAAVILFLVFTQVAQIQKIGLNNGLVLAGLVIGSVLPYLFTSWINNGSRVEQGDNGNGDYGDNDDNNDNAKLEGEALQQESGGIKNQEYYVCRESLLVLLAAVAIPLLTGFLLGKQVLAALLIGSSGAGILLVVVRAENYEPDLSILIKFLLIVSLAIAAPLLAV